jgi:hypothetical protein
MHGAQRLLLQIKKTALVHTRFSSREEFMTTIESTTDLGSLRTRLEGAVLAPGDDGWTPPGRSTTLRSTNGPP